MGQWTQQDQDVQSGERESTEDRQHQVAMRQLELVRAGQGANAQRTAQDVQGMLLGNNNNPVVANGYDAEVTNQGRFGWRGSDGQGGGLSGMGPGGAPPLPPAPMPTMPGREGAPGLPPQVPAPYVSPIGPPPPPNGPNPGGGRPILDGLMSAAPVSGGFAGGNVERGGGLDQSAVMPPPL